MIAVKRGNYKDAAAMNDEVACPDVKLVGQDEDCIERQDLAARNPGVL